MSPSEVVHGYKPRKHINLIPMMQHPRVSESASAIASHVHNLHKEISRKIQENNVHYNTHARVRRIGQVRDDLTESSSTR